MIHIGRSIRKLRTDRKISQQDLAASADLTPSFLSLVENGQRRPSLAVLQRIAAALELPEEAIVWDAIELPSDLSDADRRICEMAKHIVRRLCEEEHAVSARETE